MQIQHEEDSSYFSPDAKESHWLDVIFVDHEPGKTPVVTINLDMQHPDFKRKAEQLVGLKQLFVDLDHKPPAVQKIVGPASEYRFEAGPTSQISSIMSQLNVPREIREAVMGNLREAWGRSPS